eukprot:2943117-Pyramimonas_sp.AAC.1
MSKCCSSAGGGGHASPAKVLRRPEPRHARRAGSSRCSQSPGPARFPTRRSFGMADDQMDEWAKIWNATRVSTIPPAAQ